MSRLQDVKNLHEDRRVRADHLFETIDIGEAQVEAMDGWETYTMSNVWNRKVYLYNPYGDSIAVQFSVVFATKSCVPVEAWLGDKMLNISTAS